MVLNVSCEFRFFQTPDGCVWTSSSFEYQFWLRYLTQFNKVTVIARVQPVASKQPDWKLSSGDNVDFFSLPYYQGLFGLFKNLPKLIFRIHQATKLEGLFLSRVPSQTASILVKLLPQNKKYALEVVGDPDDVFASGVGGKVFAPLLRKMSTKSLAKQCKNAVGVSYVTKHYLQRKYPARKQAVTGNYSSIQLTPKHFIDQPRVYQNNAHKLIFVGSLNQLYKAPDILLHAFAKLASKDKHFQLTIVGAGIYCQQLQALALSLNIQEQVTFAGEVKSEQVFTLLTQADVFVLPSRTEGLPRAMIEAMAQGMPCVGSQAGGIPELLPPQFCVPINDVNALYTALNNLCHNTALLTEQSAANLATSHQYSAEVLDQRRNDFYQAIKACNQ